MVSVCVIYCLSCLEPETPLKSTDLFDIYWNVITKCSDFKITDFIFNVVSVNFTHQTSCSERLVCLHCHVFTFQASVQTMTLKVSMSQQELSYGQRYVTVLQDGLQSLFDCAHRWMFSLGVNVIMADKDSVAQGSSTHNTASNDYSQYSPGTMNLCPHHHIACCPILSFFFSLLSTHLYFTFTLSFPASTPS